MVHHSDAHKEHGAANLPPQVNDELVEAGSVIPFGIHLLSEAPIHHPPAASPVPPSSDPIMEVHEFWRTSIPPPLPSPLNYWHQQAHFWPHLAAVAQKIFVLSATSAETERVFSLAGSIGDDLRGRLTEVFCARNMHLLPPPK